MCKSTNLRTTDFLDTPHPVEVPKQHSQLKEDLIMTTFEKCEFDKVKFFQEISEYSKQLVVPKFTQNTTTGWACRLEGRVSKEKWFLLKFDGGSRGNPGLAGAGYVLFEKKQNCDVKDMSPEAWTEVYHGQCFLGDNETCNTAEYVALNQGLRAAQLLGIMNLLVEGDSNLVVQQITGTWRVKAENLRGLCKHSQNLITKFENFEIRHIERAMNTRADQLANRAMNSKVSCAGYSKPSAQLPSPEFKYNPDTSSLYSSKHCFSKEKWYLLQVGGRSRNPGPSGAGYVLFEQEKNCDFKDMSPEAGKEVFHGQCFLNEDTFNIANYVALNEGLRAARLLRIENLLVEGECELVVQQITGAWQVKAEKLQRIYQESQNLIGQFTNFEIRLIGKVMNTRATQLAKCAMDSRASFAEFAQQKSTHSSDPLITIHSGTLNHEYQSK